MAADPEPTALEASYNIHVKVAKREAWMDLAACRGLDPSIFVVGVGGSTATAKRICSGCPVTGRDGPCYNFAVRLLQDGVHGGYNFTKGKPSA